MASTKPSETLKGAGHVIFDFDGTLYKIHVNWKELKEKLYGIAGEMGLGGDFPSLRDLYAESADHPDVKKELLRLQTYYEILGRDDSIPVNQGIAAAKWRLAHGMGSSICSSNTRSVLLAMVGDWGFNPVIALDDISAPKPDPEGLNRIISGTGLPLSDIVMLGNSEFDSVAAERAGIEYIDVADIEKRWFV